MNLRDDAVPINDISAGSNASPSRLKTWACKSCQTRKIKCDGLRPLCSTCVAHSRDCHYDLGAPKVRSRVPGSRRHVLEQRRAKQQLDQAGSDTSNGGNASGNAQNQGGVAPTPKPTSAANTAERSYFSPGPSDHALSPDHVHDGQVDVTAHMSLDQSGHVEVRGPTNTLYEAEDAGLLQEERVSNQYASAILTANAAVERQKEAGYRETVLSRGEIEGVSAELALHLLDIHWSRHHFFLVTYRPAFMRDMMIGGPYYSKLLFFAMMAVSSRYSERFEVGGGDHSAESGSFFYGKCKELLFEAMDSSSIPTATALLLLGNALVSARQVDRGWLYTGMGIRMIINLGLHLNISNTRGSRKKQSLEDMEIRKRLFWGAYVSEKLQSLYLGRPIFIHEKDVLVPKTFLDLYEESEAWYPVPYHGDLPVMASNSVTNFICQCKLSEICESIMSSFYAIKSKIRPSAELHNSRNKVRDQLLAWLKALPLKLAFTPWLDGGQRMVPIHVIVLHTIYFSLVILLERPFVANGHLISTTDKMGSWSDCTMAAEKIAYLLQAYRTMYTFRRVPYQLCYATYVASTILVRNANTTTGGQPASIGHLSICLKAFEEMKLAHSGTARMESVIRILMRRLSVNVASTSPEASIFAQIPANFHSRNEDLEIVVENPPLSLGIIPQSFAPTFETDSTTYPAGSAGAPGAEFQMLDMVGEFPHDFSGYGTDLPDFNWDIAGERIDYDLLFGVLEEI